MGYRRAKKELSYALKNQKRISIPKLRKLLQDLNISIKKPPRDVEISYLKGELKRTQEELKKWETKEKQ